MKKQNKKIGEKVEKLWEWTNQQCATFFKIRNSLVSSRYQKGLKDRRHRLEWLSCLSSEKTFTRVKTQNKQKLKVTAKSQGRGDGMWQCLGGGGGVLEFRTVNGL